MRIISAAVAGSICLFGLSSLSSAAVDLEGTATLLGSINVHTGQAIGAESSGPEVVTLNSVYSNVTTFTGSVVTNGGSANQAGNNITTMIADDLDMTAAANIIGFRFSVGNLNTTAVSARPRVRFYADNAGVPGTYLGGFSFNAISFPANSVNVLGTTIAPFPMPANIWAGMVFDNNTGATGATLAQLDLLGQGSFDPVDVGSSTDNLFGTTAAGSFNVNDPVGVTFNFGANPVANVGWELVSVPEPTMLSVIGAVASFVLARRRA